jgi:UDP:flavonoid glycosyltransferase YjiC (YdhE family)
VFRLVRPLAFALHAAPINRFHRRQGFSGYGGDLRRAYTDGDLTLYADIPELIPIFDAPANHKYIGPVVWSPAVAPPPWLADALCEDPPIYVSLGSSGDAQLLPTILEGLLPLGRPIIVATAGRAAQLPKTSGVWAADYLPGDEIAAKACVVVCNGGSPSTQQALLHGVPVVGIASNMDQYLNMDYIQQFGAGLLIRTQHANARSVRSAVRLAIGSARLRERAQTIATLAKRIRPEVNLGGTIRSLIDAPKLAPLEHAA